MDGSKGESNSRGRTSLVVQWLRHCTSNARGKVSIPGQETKTDPHISVRYSQKKFF